MRTKVTEVGTYLCEDICSAGDPCCCGGTDPNILLLMFQNLPRSRVGGMNSDVVGKYFALQLFNLGVYYLTGGNL